MHTTIWAMRGLAACALVLGSTASWAKPPAARAWCETYPTSPLCVGRTVSCTACHTAAPDLNGYGEEIQVELLNSGYEFFPAQEEADFISRLPAILRAVEPRDSDSDGLSNLEEVTLGTMPGNTQSHYVAPPVVGAWDPRFAYRRASVAFCGEPPTYTQLQAVPTDVTAGRAAVQTLLDTCLASDFWRNEQLHRLADKRIRPMHAVGYDLGNTFALGDYRYDYRLFSHALSGNRDARDLLRANYHVDATGNLVQGPFDVGGGGGNLGQPLQTDKRAGMITTAWFLVIHTMFSGLPRTTAAQAYRAYLGQDIALSEGLRPVAGEPVDVDQKGVTPRTCNVCHSTLDPLAYAFSAYQGIAGQATGTFSVVRMAGVRGAGNNTTASIFDVDLDANPALDPAQHGVVGWASVAVAHDAFARTVVFLLAEHALGRIPDAGDTQQLLPLVTRFKAVHAFVAEQAIRDIVNTDAFGRP